MIKVFVSGYYDIVHAGHLQFFREARALGDHLTVSFASAEVLWRERQRRSSLPDDHKLALLASLDRWMTWSSAPGSRKGSNSRIIS
jgi:cytidyltransferase-like protein